MVVLRNVLLAVSFAAALSACGPSAKRSSFTTEGLRAPEGSCSVQPSRIGLAEKIRNIDEGNGCEIPNAWKVQSLGPVSFSRTATLNCSMADPLHEWLEDSVQTAAQRTFGESVVSIDVAASYSCRPRNNKRGARMSEHGFGNAIDIAAFTLESGRKVTVANGWRGDSRERRFLRSIHEEACGPFRTVLGPDADRDHWNHFHLDLQNRKNGATYCR